MAEMFMACGQQEKALALLAKIQDDLPAIPRLSTTLKYHQQSKLLDVLLRVHQQEMLLRTILVLVLTMIIVK